MVVSEMLSQTLLVLTETARFLSFGNCLWENRLESFPFKQGVENFICHPLNNRRPQFSQRETRNLNQKVILPPSSNSEEPYIPFSGLLDS